MTISLSRDEMRQTTISDAPWWRDAVIYEVYVRSFADGNGDGNGDLAGARSRIGYLASLGITAIWLTPFYRSPMNDGGYDVADYRDVDPTFGTLADYDALVDEAHAHGLRVIVDIVPNHTSSAHRWFTEALAAAPGSAARGRYIFRPGRGTDGELPPNDWQSIFGGPAWTRTDGPDREWYLHLFDSSQPDLDWTNPDVHAEFEDVLRFWLDRGTDGFRIDVAHGMIKADGLPDVGSERQIELLGNAVLPYFDQDGVHDIYRRWRSILDGYDGERVAVAEAWVPNHARLANYVRPDELHQAFNFHYLTTDWNAADLRATITDALASAGAVGAPTTWVLSNHDVKRHVTRYGDGEIGTRRARAAALLMLALPGSAYVYQGEELGLPEVLDLPEDALQDPVWRRSGYTDRGRDGCRVPLPWSGAEQPYGFSTGTPWLPQPRDWAVRTASAQADAPESMLTLYRDALALRTSLVGEPMTWAATDGDTAGAMVFARGDGFMCTVNTSDDDVTLRCPGTVLLTSTPLPSVTAVTPPGAPVTIPANATVWWRVSAAGSADRSRE
jgi:alpha-glucosidase